jgi:hypothetical protein
VDEFNAVLAAELQQIEFRRQKRHLAAPPPEGKSGGGATPPLEDVRAAAHKRQLVGLAFSGGGIRSATFNLGVLQGLAGLGLLKYCDYLSTVSGGGYIGAWLCAWMRRRGAEEVEKQLHPDRVRRQTAAARKDDLDPIQHLRRYSNYLAPWTGLLSADRWVLWASYLRNFLLNQLVLLPAAFIVVLLARLVMLIYLPLGNVDDWDAYFYGLYGRNNERAQLEPWWCLALVLLAFVALALIGFTNAFRAVATFLPAPVRAVPPAPAARPPRGTRQRRLARVGGMWWIKWLWQRVFVAELGTKKWVWWRVLAPQAAAAVVFSYIGPYALPLSEAFKQVSSAPGEQSTWPVWVADLAVFVVVGVALVAGSYAAATWRRDTWHASVFCWCLAVGVVWGLTLYGVYGLLHWFFAWDGTESLMCLEIAGTALLVTLGPPLVLLSVVVSIAFGVGMLRHELTEAVREWWASLAARLLMVAAAWASVNLVSLYATALVLWSGPWVRAALASGWVLTVATGVLAAGSPRTDGKPRRPSYLDGLARLSLHVFVAGVFVLVSLLVHWAVDKPPNFDPNDQTFWPYRTEPEQAPFQVIVDRPDPAGVPTVLTKREFRRVPDNPTAVQQRYWFGMVNTRPATEPRRDWVLWLNDQDIDFLQSHFNLPAKHREKLHDIRFKVWTPGEFQAALGNSHLMGQSAAWLAAHPDVMCRIIAVARRNAAKGPDKDGFIFRWKEMDRSGVLNDADPPRDLERRLKYLQWRQWEYEELQDTIDRLLPEARYHETRKQIMGRAFWGGSFVDYDPFWAYFRVSCWLVGCAVVLGLALWRVDVNAFSLHGMYINRLVRAYLGASREPKPDPPAQVAPNADVRDPNPFTLFDPRDDLPLYEFNSDCAVTYDGPYPLVNVALNLVGGDELAWQERKAAPFVLTPRFCGSKLTRYRPTGQGGSGYGGGIQLGTAVAISGAAASPNMGYHSSSAVTFLLTVFNARLGAWLGNPCNPDTWRRKNPWWGFAHLFMEMLGFTNDRGPYVYLSDGGHFENLGAYELVQRRCRYVVVCDAGQDEHHGFEDLANLIRKVRVDLGIRIDLAPDSLRLQKEPRRTRWHCAIGKIRYDEVDEEALPGTLVYLKASLTGDEPADVLHYAASHPTFPHETTANQFYTESQFESYRMLGQHIVEAVFERAVADAGAPKDGEGKAWCQKLFGAVVRRWFDLPPEYEASFVESTRGFMDVQAAFRADKRLSRLTLEIYPELDLTGSSSIPPATETPAEADDRHAAELRILLQMLQVMENAYLSLNLEVNYAHPLNRGWLDVFHRWTSAPTVRAQWPLLRTEFAQDFVQFCEKQMRLPDVKVRHKAVQAGSTHGLTVLVREFSAEWPEWRDWLQAQIPAAVQGQMPAAWLIYPDLPSPGTGPATDPPPVGLIFVAPFDLPNDKWHDPAIDDYILLIWVRGAYRNTGLGSSVIRELLRDDIPKILHPLPPPRPDRFLLSPRKRYLFPLARKLLVPRPKRLRVRLPARDLTGPGGKLQKEMWLTFFHQLGFTRMAPPIGPAAHPEDLELKLDLDGGPDHALRT